MRTPLIKHATGYLATTSLVVCLLVSSETSAMTSRNAFKRVGESVTAASIITTQARPSHSDKPQVLASAKSETAPPAAAPKEKKIEEKKTIGRCWKRLMNMAREIRHAHTSTSK